MTTCKLDAVTTPWNGPRPPISVIILTKDEADNLPACLESCCWADDVHVVDSGSADATCDIARAAGAHVHHHPFTSFAAQRNWANRELELRHDWVFHLDADERFTPALVHELDAVFKTDAPFVGYLCPNQLMFLGVWLRYAGQYPAYQTRFMHRRKLGFIDSGHGQREEPGQPVGTLTQPYLHYNFSKGLNDWFEKHNRYSTLEAAAADDPGPLVPVLAKLLSRDRIERRRGLKDLSYRIPGRAFLLFAHALLLQRAFRDGPAGIAYAQLRLTYDLMTQLKISERRAR